MDIPDYFKEDAPLEYIPFYWHIPRSAGGMIKQLMGECRGLTLASWFPADILFGTDAVRIMRYDGVKYFNVNLGTKEGIQRASNMDIIHTVPVDQDFALADATISPDPYNMATTLFKLKSREAVPVKGGMFAMIRNPIERELSNFFDVRSQAKGEDVATYEISDWIGSPFYARNIMVRRLVNKLDPEIEVTMNDLLVAKEILRRKCIIGLLELKFESWNRFQMMYKNRWRLDEREESPSCQERLLNWGWKNKNPMRPLIDFTLKKSLRKRDPQIIDMETYKEIASLNQLDMLLYEYCKHLFWEQEKLFYGSEQQPATNEDASNTTDTSEVS